MKRFLPSAARADGAVVVPPYHTPGTDGSPSPFRFAGVVEAVRRQWITILLVAVAVLSPGVYWIRREVPIFKAEATIRLRDVQGELTGGLAGGSFGDLTRSVDPVKSQMEVLTSRAVATQVVDSSPELRVVAIGFPASGLDSLRLKPDVTVDSINLDFLPGAVVASSLHGSTSAIYGTPLQLGGVRFIAPRRLGSHGAFLIRPAEPVVGTLMRNLQVQHRDQTDVIDVTYLDPDRIRAQRVVNRVVQVFQSFNASAAQRQSTLRREFLEGQLRYHDSLLNAARVELSVFRGRQRAYSTKLRLSTEQAGLMQLQVEREGLAADRQVYQNLLTDLQAAEHGPSDTQVGAIMSAPGIATNPVVAQMYGQLTRYQGIRDSLTTGRFGRPTTNPEVQQVDSLIASVKAKLVGAVGGYLRSLDSRIASLDQLRAQGSSTFPELSATEEEEAGLEEQVEAARVTVGQLRAEYEKARLAEAVEVGQVEIVSLAMLPGQPIGVGAVRRMVFLALVGLGLGLVVAILRERLNTSVRRRGQVEQMLNVTELAVIPPVVIRRRHVGARTAGRSLPGRSTSRNGTNGHAPKVTRLGDGLVVASDVHSIAAEAYRLLRTNLLFSLPDGPLHTVLVTSPAPGDGKTTVAANLAIAFAQQGMRVLLVDGDLRRGRVHDLFHMSREPGLSEVLLGEAHLDAAARPTPVNGLYALSTGSLPDAPNELVGSEVMRTFLRESTREYAMVVIDSPPVLAASDAAVMSTLSDATVVVVRAGRTHEDEAQATLSQLEAVGAKVVGAVLNDPDAAVGAGAGYYYYKEYYGKPT